MSFNMRKDLREGDRIRRISDSGTLTEGEVYTFVRYSSTGYVNVEGFGTNNYDPDYFELVSTKYKRVTDFKYAKAGDKAYSMEFGEVEIIENDPEDASPIEVRYKDSDEDTRTMRFNYDGVCVENYNTERTLFHSKPDFEIPTKEIIIEDEMFYDEFIDAMKKTAKEYIDGTHDWDASSCALCQTVKKVLKLDGSITTESCRKVCPWFIITGKRCVQSKTGISRAQELLEWIKIYEDKKNK